MNCDGGEPACPTSQPSHKSPTASECARTAAAASRRAHNVHLTNSDGEARASMVAGWNVCVRSQSRDNARCGVVFYWGTGD